MNQVGWSGTNIVDAFQKQPVATLQYFGSYVIVIEVILLWPTLDTLPPLRTVEILASGCIAAQLFLGAMYRLREDE